MMMVRQKSVLHPKDNDSFAPHPHRNGMRYLRLVAFFDMQEDTAGVFLPRTRTGQRDRGERHTDKQSEMDLDMIPRQKDRDKEKIMR